jgi:SAM-dependent methyltransferase
MLQVGCGDGAIAEGLKDDEREVVALDRSAAAVAEARRRGVLAITGDFFDFSEGAFDAVLFSRTLHLLTPLGEAVEHARALLAPGGLLIADELAVENVDRETARWFFELSDLLEAVGLVAPVLERVVPASNQLERWYEEHEQGHSAHAGEDMAIAIGTRLQLVSQDRGPYLYRYICDRIEASERGARVARWVRDLESLRVSEGSLRPAGLRLIAKKAPPGDLGRPAPLAS